MKPPDKKRMQKRSRRPSSKSRRAPVNVKPTKASTGVFRQMKVREDLVSQACLEALGLVLHESWLSNHALENVLRQKKVLYSHERRLVAERVYAYLRKPQMVDFVLAKLWPGHSQLPKVQIDMLRLALSRTLDGEPPTQVAPSVAFLGGTEAQLSQVEGLAKQSEKLPKVERVALQTSLPEFVVKRLFDELGTEAEATAHALNVRAPLTVRVNTLKVSREDLTKALEAEGVIVTETALSPLGLHLETRINAHSLAAFKAGHFEIQDEGSQLLGMLVDAPPRKVIDACAGAGGKTLQLSAQMGNRGELFALDVDQRRLNELRLRARRAGAFNVRIHKIESDNASVAQFENQCERVFVDAPCSGSGTLRRKPDARARLTEATIDEHAALQFELLMRFAKLVKPGGRLIYGTCSIFRQENEDVVARFLSASAEFKASDVSAWLGEALAARCVVDGNLRLFPHRHNTDGFFGAVLVRNRE